MALDYKAAKSFAGRWKNKKLSEDQFTQIFWIDLLQSIYDIDYNDGTNVIFEYVTSGKGKIDVWIRGSSTMIEMKSSDVDLDKPEPRQGELKTPFKQVYDYAISFPREEQPDYLITCNFKTFRVYSRKEHGDLDLEKHAVEFTLEELGRRPEHLEFLINPKNSRLFMEKEISEEAGTLIGQLHKMLKEAYHDQDSPETKHALNVLCVRLVFCMFCEDAQLFNETEAFSNYLSDVPAANIREALKRLFRGLATPEEERDPYDIRLKKFPYVNGGLFEKEYEIPNFSEEMKDFMINKIARPLDWSKISPTIFGAIFESTLNPETQEENGMYYTTIASIHKVIDPLFLDELNAELDNINALTSLSVKEKNRRYAHFRKKISSLTFFDPACGSGNFLTETYLSLRKLEDKLNLAQQGDRQIYLGMDDTYAAYTVSLNQFYGLEKEDFAADVARTALWISRLKANNDSANLLDMDTKDFPLSDRANIRCENALTSRWEDFIQPSQCSFIIGNPPFYGARKKTKEQSAEIRDLMSQKHKGCGDLDYVCGWYRKAADYMKDTSIEAALVSTNSITQGEQVSILWKPLLEEGITINFAHKNFAWDNKATVHCIVICFSYVPRTHKYIYENDEILEAKNINPYLIDFDNLVVEGTKNPLCNVTNMEFGNMPNDAKGQLSNYSTEKMLEIVSVYPEAQKYFRRFMGADEFIKDLERWCIWLVGVDEKEYSEILPFTKAIEKVRVTRESSNREATKRLAASPMLFGEIRQPDGDYLLIPRHSSENRKYIPIGFMTKDIICGDSNMLIPNASLYSFGILTSSVHMAWMRIASGKLEMRYRYSKEIVYNTFPWCVPNKEQISHIEQTAQGILDVRNRYSGETLAKLYDDKTMPDELRAAHKANDDAVFEAYGFTGELTDHEIFARLMKMYQKLTGADNN